MLTGRLARDPELRVTAGGSTVTTFVLATNEYAGPGKEKSEFHTVVTWDKLAEVCGRWLGKGQQVGVEGRIQTRTWDDERGRHWRTEIVASNVEMLSSRRKRDFNADAAADGLAERAAAGATAGATGPAASSIGPADDEADGDVDGSDLEVAAA
jgi:single-strand DNA-binding protein